MDNQIKLRCFVCPSEYGNVEQLCKHIKNVHKISGHDNYQCKLCPSVLGELNPFKRHLETHVKKAKRMKLQVVNNIEINEAEGASNNVSANLINEAESASKNGGANLRQFEELIQASALKFTLNLCSDAMIPRQFAFDVIGNVRKYIVAAFTEGITSVIVPLIAENTVKDQVDAFIQIGNSFFCDVGTESRLDTTLSKADLLFPIRKFPIGVYKENHEELIIPEESSDSCGEDNMEEDNENAYDESEDSPLQIDVEEENEQESESDDEYDTRFDHADARIKVATGTMMPIQFQLRKFFEEKDVFKALIDHTNKIKNENVLNHFINGKLWKSKLSSFSEDQIVIPYHLYSDDTQINNALGTHCSPGLESCVYYTFPTIPPQYASRLVNISVAMLFSSKDSKEFGPNCCFAELVRELNALAHEGVKITVDGKEQIIFFVLGLFLGDNASLNEILGFCSCSSKYFCKHCQLHKYVTQKETVEIPSMVRTKENYDEDICVEDEELTGIKWESIFNTIFLFHVIHSAGVDIMHDLSEGVLRYNMSAIIRFFIKKKVFKLATLNYRKNKFFYDYPDRGNRSSDITMEKLNKGKLSMTASEMMTFVHNFGILVGDLVSTQSRAVYEVWKFYLKTVEVVDLVYLTSYTESDLLKLKSSISSMNEMYIKLFKETLKPKHHFLTHYPRLILWFGPLRYISSLRYEAKHRIVKKYTKNTVSRKNISFSIGRKLQYAFADILLRDSGGGLKDKLEYKPRGSLILSTEDFFGLIENSSLLNEVAHIEVLEIESLSMNGIFFSKNLFVPEMNDNNEIEVFQIYKVLLLLQDGLQSPYLLYKKYAKTIWCEHFASYEITSTLLEEKLVLKRIPDLLENHILPISLHTVRGKKMFRLRNY